MKKYKQKIYKSMKMILKVLVSMVLFVLGAIFNRKAMEELDKSGLYDKLNNIGHHHNNNDK